jgi:hypothetical protein
VLAELHPEACAELRSAALWYDQRRAGLGDEFIAHVATTLDRIGDAPLRIRKWPDFHSADAQIRRATLRRFPYVKGFQGLFRALR